MNASKRKKLQPMEIRFFNNRNASLCEKYLSFWEQKLDPTFYDFPDVASSGRATARVDGERERVADSGAHHPFSYWNLFKTEILDSCFWTPSASCWAVEGSPEEPKPIACLVAGLAPTDDALDGDDASLLAPLFAAGVADVDKATAARLLIEASENALRAKGVRRVYAGGAPPRSDVKGYAPTGAPFLNGVYGTGSPVGFFDDDGARDYFIDAGYAPERNEDGDERAYVERKIDAGVFYGSASTLPSGWSLTREPRSAASWRLATIERDFLNPRRFCVFGLDGVEVKAVAWVYDLLRRSPKTGALVVKTVVSRLSVRPAYYGEGLDSALVAALIEDAARRTAKTTPDASLEISVVVPETDVEARDFWDAQGFEVGRRSTPLVKTLDA